MIKVSKIIHNSKPLGKFIFVVVNRIYIGMIEVIVMGVSLFKVSWIRYYLKTFPFGVNQESTLSHKK